MQSSKDRTSTSIAACAIVFVLLSWVALNLENYLAAQQISDQRQTPIDSIVSIEQFLRLCPVMVLLLFPGIKHITVPYAIIAFVILIGRGYYLLKFFHLGADALPHAFDWASLLQSILGRASIGVLAFWILIRLTFLLSDAAQKNTD